MAKLAQVAKAVAESETPKTFMVLQPNDEPYTGLDGTPSTFTHLGSESKAYKAARDIIQRRALKSRRQALTPEQLRQNRVDLAAATMTGWSGWDDGTVDLPFSIAGVKDLLVADHILTQLEESIGEHANFSSASSNSSPT